MSVTTTKKPAAKATFSMLGGSLTQPHRPAPKPLAAGKPVAPPPAPPPPPEAVAPPAPPRVVAPDLDDARIAARVRNLALVQEKLPDVFNRGALRRLPADVGERPAALGPSQQEAYDVLKWWRGMPAYRAEVQRRRAAEEYRRGRLDDDDRVGAVEETCACSHDASYPVSVDGGVAAVGAAAVVAAWEDWLPLNRARRLGATEMLPGDGCSDRSGLKAEVYELAKDVAPLQLGVAFVDVVELEVACNQMIEFQVALLPRV
jgi:hypothetical protein